MVETAETEGYYSLLIPTRFANGLFGDTAPLAETWTTVTALAAVTRRIRFLVAIRPGFISTGLFGQMAAALDQISGGRLRERSPRLWNGISKVRVNLGTAIVGDPAQVVDELAAYWRLGIDEFILSGFPHVEECRRVASDVLPGLRAAIERERLA